MNGWALCPALENQIHRVHIVEYSPEVLHTISCTWNTLKPFSVAVYCIGKSDVWLDNKCIETETEYPEIAALWHHPNTPRYIGNYRTPSPGIPLIILQSKEDLIKEKARLKEAGYYSNWKS